MCLDCGCGEPDDDHGDSRHLTLDRIDAAASASGIPREEAIRNIQQGLQQTGGAGSVQGQSAMGD